VTEALRDPSVLEWAYLVLESPEAPMRTKMKLLELDAEMAGLEAAVFAHGDDEWYAPKVVPEEYGERLYTSPSYLPAKELCREAAWLHGTEIAHDGTPGRPIACSDIRSFKREASLPGFTLCYRAVNVADVLLEERTQQPNFIRLAIALPSRSVAQGVGPVSIWIWGGHAGENRIESLQLALAAGISLNFAANHRLRSEPGDTHDVTRIRRLPAGFTAKAHHEVTLSCRNNRVLVKRRPDIVRALGVLISDSASEVQPVAERQSP
jgi:hypothetical protein